MNAPEPGEHDLQKLLANAEPELDDATYVFATFPLRELPAGVDALCTFQEAEGTTLIVLQGEAERHGVAHTFPCRRITLKVHSALEAVGFLAAVMARLAAHGIPTNAVSAYYHDHLFVPLDRAEDAMELLRNLKDA